MEQAKALREFASTIAAEETLDLDVLTQSVRDPAAFVGAHRKWFRWLAPNAPLPRNLGWLALIYVLADAGVVAEIDWKEAFSEVRGQLDAVARPPLAADAWDWADALDDEIETESFLRRAARHLAKLGRALVSLQTDSDSYALVVVKARDLARLKTLARDAGGKLDTFGFRSFASEPKAKPKARANKTRIDEEALRNFIKECAVVVERESKPKAFILTAPLAAMNAGRAEYLLGNDSEVASWLRRAVRLDTARAEQSQSSHGNDPKLSTLRIDWYELEILGGAYLTGDLERFGAPYERWGFEESDDKQRPYRHWGPMGARAYQMLRGKRLTNPNAGAKADAKRWKMSATLELPSAVVAKDMARAGKLLEEHLEAFRRSVASYKAGVHSFFAAAVCKRLGKVPPLSDRVREWIPMRLLRGV